MSQKYLLAIEKIDEAHAEDPKKIRVNGEKIPYELHYARKMSEYLQKRSPDAPETLKLAVRAQHFRRWEVPRDSYPKTKVGYHMWRNHLKQRQAQLVEQILDEVPYDEVDRKRVGALIRKEDLKSDEETQVLEDVACLVFLEDQFADFEKEHDEDKIITILRKTWAKMTKEGQQLAMEIAMEGRPKEVLSKALAA